jgi:phosphoethanolamine N-methyltransferase
MGICGMTQENQLEYDDDMVDLLASVWGEGYMSPGGPEEVDQVLSGLSLEGRTVLDIGCGAGGIDLHLVEAHRAAHVTGIDIERGLVDRCRRMAASKGLEDRLDFILVDPGPLPFDEDRFDFIFSKDAIIHIPDKEALALDIFRVLKPGGWIAASDWLAGYEGPPSPAMQAYIDAEGLDFALANARRYEAALEHAGFEEISLNDRNAWYREQTRKDRARLTGPLYEELVAKMGQEFIDREVDVWNKGVVVSDSGELCPTHLRGRKPAR